MTGCPSEENQCSLAITIEQNVSFRLPMTYTDSAGVPINLTGCTAAMQCRSNIGSDTPFLTLTTANSRIVLGGVLGTILLEVDAATTGALTAQSPGVYDLLLTYPSGFVERILKGPVTIERSVTR